jgi:hypothetical protein
MARTSAKHGPHQRKRPTSSSDPEQGNKRISKRRAKGDAMTRTKPKMSFIVAQCRRIATLRSTVSLPNHTRPTLRQSHPASSGPPPAFPFLLSDFVPPRPLVEEASSVGKVFKLKWPTNPKNFLVIKKRRDDKVTEAAVTFAR